MTTPLELAKQLDVRVEALMLSLAESGATGLDYESDLSPEQVELMRAQFTAPEGRSLWRRLLDRLRRKPDRKALERQLYERATAGTGKPDVAPEEKASPALVAPPARRGGQELPAEPPQAVVEQPAPSAPAAAAPKEAEALDLDRLELAPGGDIDLSALLGDTTASAEPAQPPAASEGDVDLAALLGAVAEPAEETPSPEDLLGLSFESGEPEDDFDLQALLESSIAEPAPAQAPKAKTAAPRREPFQLPVEPSAPALPSAAAGAAPLSRFQKIWMGVAAAAMLVLAGWAGRYAWVYYQEHRPGGDRRLYDQGVAHLDKNEYDAAAERLGKLIEVFPESASSEMAFFKYGEALFGQGRYREAVRIYRSALAFQDDRVKATHEVDYPDMALRKDAQIRIARALGLAGNYEDAAKEYKRLLEVYPRDDISRDLKLELADLYLQWGIKRGEPEPLQLSIAWHELAAAEYPSSQDVVDWNDAAARAGTELAALESASAEEYYGDAREALETALERGAELGFDAGQEATLLSELGAVGEALANDVLTASAFDRLLTQQPTLEQEAQAYTGLAEIEMRRAEKARNEALRILRRIEEKIGRPAVSGAAPLKFRFFGAEESVDEKSSLINAALLQLRDSTKDAAVRDLAKAGLTELGAEQAAYAAALRYADLVAQRSDGAEKKAIGYYIRGDVAWQEGRLGDMVQDYQEAMKLTSRLPDHEERAHLRIINYLYVVKKDYQNALERIQEVLLRYPNDHYSYYAMYLSGLCQEALGQHRKAADAFAQVVVSFPESRFTDRAMLRDALFMLPQELERAGDYERAVQEYISAIEKAPDDPRSQPVRLHLADCHRQAGDLDRAVGVYKIFLQYFPDHPETTAARLALADCYLQFYDFESGRGQFREVAARTVGTETEELALARLAESYVAQARTAAATDAAALCAEAEANYRALQKKFPVSKAAFARLADLAEGRRDWAEAYRQLQASIKAATDELPDPRIALRMAELASRQSRWLDLLACLTGPPPDELDAREKTRWNFYRAEAYRQDGKDEAAMAAYREAQKTATPRSLLADEIDRKLRDLQYRQKAQSYSRLP